MVTNITLIPDKLTYLPISFLIFKGKTYHMYIPKNYIPFVALKLGYKFSTVVARLLKVRNFIEVRQLAVCLVWKTHPVLVGVPAVCLSINVILMIRFKETMSSHMGSKYFPN